MDNIKNNIIKYIKDDKNKILCIIVLLSIFLFLISFFKLFVFSQSKCDYSEFSNSSYVVNLKDNEYYDDVASAGTDSSKYISSLIDNIEINFNYSINSKSKFNYSGEYYVEAITKVYGDRDKTSILYEKSDIIVDKTVINEKKVKNIDINRTVKINYHKFNDLALKFNTEYGLSNASELVVILRTKVVDGGFDGGIVSYVTIPLTEQVVQVNVRNKNINRDDLNVKKFSLDGINLLFFIIFILSGLVIVYVLFKLVLYIIDYFNSNMSYEEKLNRIKNTYDNIIVDITSDVVESDYNVVMVKSFDELVDMHNNLGSPILFRDVNVGVEAHFSIIKSNTMYKYILKNDSVKFDEDII